jgi:hypothetical protein
MLGVPYAVYEGLPRAASTAQIYPAPDGPRNAHRGIQQAVIGIDRHSNGKTRTIILALGN